MSTDESAHHIPKLDPEDVILPVCVWTLFSLQEEGVNLTPHHVYRYREAFSPHLPRIRPMEDIQRSADMALKFLKIALIVNARFSFDLPAQNLVVALREFGKQTDLSLAYRVEDIDTIEMWCRPWIGLPG